MSESAAAGVKSAESEAAVTQDFVELANELAEAAAKITTKYFRYR